MKKTRWTGILLLLALLLPLPTESETRQGIIVDGADSTLDRGMIYSPDLVDNTAAVTPRIVVEGANSSSTYWMVWLPPDLILLLDQVMPRIIVEHANSMAHRDLLEVPPALQELIDAVKPRLIIAYANSTRTLELGYPCSILDDGAPPEISDVQAIDIRASAATIAWTTSEPATSTVSYGLDQGPYPDKVTDGAYVVDHAVTLTGLSPDTIYYYKVGSGDRCGGQAESGEYSFTTMKPLYLPVTLRNQ